MHLLLTDRLTCPRCGPTFGLILRADHMVDRRVHDGVLGCPNCRDGFEIRAGFADLRAPPRGPLPSGSAGHEPEDWTSERPAEDATRVAALLGVVRGPGPIALVGDAAAHAAGLARAVEDLQVVAVDPDVGGWRDAPRVSRLAAAPGIPFFSGMLRGVVVDGALGPEWIGEAVRVVAPKCRVVVTHAPAGVSERLRSEGLEVLAEEAETVVAARG